MHQLWRGLVSRVVWLTLAAWPPRVQRDVDAHAAQVVGRGCRTARCVPVASGQTLSGAIGLRIEVSWLAIVLTPSALQTVCSRLPPAVDGDAEHVDRRGRAGRRRAGPGGRRRRLRRTSRCRRRRRRSDRRSSRRRPSPRSRAAPRDRERRARQRRGAVGRRQRRTQGRRGERRRDVRVGRPGGCARRGRERGSCPARAPWCGWCWPCFPRSGENVPSTADDQDHHRDHHLDERVAVLVVPGLARRLVTHRRRRRSTGGSTAASAGSRSRHLACVSVVASGLADGAVAAAVASRDATDAGRRPGGG